MGSWRNIPITLTTGVLSVNAWLQQLTSGLLVVQDQRCGLPQKLAPIRSYEVQVSYSRLSLGGFSLSGRRLLLHRGDALACGGDERVEARVSMQ